MKRAHEVVLMRRNPPATQRWTVAFRADRRIRLKRPATIFETEMTR